MTLFKMKTLRYKDVQSVLECDAVWLVKLVSMASEEPAAYPVRVEDCYILKIEATGLFETSVASPSRIATRGRVRNDSVHYDHCCNDFAIFLYIYI
jgi:hypothetical protein